MITGYEVFGLYQALKLHFTTEQYDFFKYNGKSNISVTVFENRKDKYYFYKLSRKFSDKKELIDFIVYNFVESDDCWVGNLLEEKAIENYRKHQKVIESLSYTFKSDCDKIFSDVSNPNEKLVVNGGEYPSLLKNALRKEIEIETLCILNKILNFFPIWSKRIQDTLYWPAFKRKILKFSPFIQFDEEKFKDIIRKIINEN